MNNDTTLRLKVKGSVISFLKGLSNEDRLEIFSIWCFKCGDEEYLCNCVVEGQKRR